MEPISATHPLPLATSRVESFDALYREYRDEVFRWALRFSAGRQAWAEDVTHDVFLKLHARLDSLDTHELGAWLYRVTANEALARLRHEASWVTRFTRLMLPSANASRPDEALELRDDASLAMAALEKLPPKQRVVVTMHILDGLSQREIARTLDLSEGYVSKLLTRAWSTLRTAGWEVDE